MFDEALDYQLEAKKLCGDVPPDQSDAITIIQLNLGFLLYRRGDLEPAEKILRATLDANPRTPPAMYALGNTLLARGLVEEGIAAHLNGLEIYIEMFGDEHALATKIYLKQESPYYTVKAYARATRMLAKAFDMEGRGGEAKRYYEQAWNLREKIDGTHGSAADTDEDYSAVMFYWDQ
ncbi:kinesin light chain [Fusarium circinatum]|uniref:Kinesin light chain n=1 Tax=Fusarium circinatum TaxID=48490 RepID=A0A8H5X889_FUSCI|nr:kinesin light chain [Fusarium circinatum]